MYIRLLCRLSETEESLGIVEAVRPNLIDDEESESGYVRSKFLFTL